MEVIDEAERTGLLVVIRSLERHAAGGQCPRRLCQVIGPERKMVQTSGAVPGSVRNGFDQFDVRRPGPGDRESQSGIDHAARSPQRELCLLQWSPAGIERFAKAVHGRVDVGDDHADVMELFQVHDQPPRVVRLSVNRLGLER